MRLTVIVPTRNRSDFVCRFLRSLRTQERHADEVIIVDSSDRPIEEIPAFKELFSREVFPDSELRYRHTTPGLPAQRNEGVRMSTGDVVFFFDDDIVLTEGYLKEIAEVFEAHEEYYGGMGLVTNLPPRTFARRIRDLLRRVFLLTEDYGDGRFKASGLASLPFGLRELSETEVLGGAFFAWRREVFEKHSFDETLPGYAYMEDADFSRRVSYDYRLFYQPKAKAAHLHATDARLDSVRLGRMYMLNHFYLFDKNFRQRGKGNTVAFWWSVLGHGILALIGRQLGLFRGYIQGINQALSRQRVETDQRSHQRSTS